jgi:hypothetical protein
MCVVIQKLETAANQGPGIELSGERKRLYIARETR